MSRCGGGDGENMNGVEWSEERLGGEELNRGWGEDEDDGGEDG